MNYYELLKTLSLESQIQRPTYWRTILDLEQFHYLQTPPLKSMSPFLPGPWQSLIYSVSYRYTFS